LKDRKRLIKASWSRCQAWGLNPEKKRLGKILSNQELQEKQATHKLLINASLPYMKLMAETFKECGSLLALINEECYVLKLVGPSKIMESRKKLGLIEGTSLREEDAGTNAAALCIEIKKPFYVSGREYFVKLLQKGSCFAAPIIDEDMLLGAIIIIHPKRSGHPHTFALVQTLARLIVREHQEITQGNLIVSVCDSLNTGVVLAEKNGCVRYANQRARHILKIKKGENIVGYFNVNLFSSKKISNEIIFSKITRQSYLITRKRYNDKLLFLCAPLEDELRKEEKIKTKLAPYKFSDIIGLEDTKAKARNLAMQNVNILIVGESGTGKELFASAVHNASPCAGARFVVVNCAAIPESLFESELFGYKKGAFTDARSDRVGRIEYASGGTLFLDEIGDLPLNIQSKLLRVIEDKCIMPLGGNEAKNVDVRFIFATNKNLEKLIIQKKFREDLFYRISTPVIKIPPLRERKHEIMALVNYFIQQNQNDHQRFISGISDKTIGNLMEYDYPGNVRELQRIIKNAYLVCEGDWIELDDLEIPGHKGSCSLQARLEECASRIIKERLLINKNNRKRTARELGISSRTLYRYLNKI
jgi:transcriptional regulator of acetoin/glycerol metabolism